MARDVPEIKTPITPGKIRDGVEIIVERLHPRPRGVDCLPVHDLEQDLTAYVGEAVRLAYEDCAAEIERLRRDLAANEGSEDARLAVAEEQVRRLRTHLNDAAETVIDIVENGPWALITDPQLRQIVGEYIADACHSIALAARLDEAAERAHDATPVRLATSLPKRGGEAS